MLVSVLRPVGRFDLESRRCLLLEAFPFLIVLTVEAVESEACPSIDLFRVCLPPVRVPPEVLTISSALMRSAGLKPSILAPSVFLNELDFALMVGLNFP